MKKLYRRAIAFSHVPLMGHFRFGDVFQLLPPGEAAPKPPFQVAHYPLVVEYRFFVPEKEYMPVTKGSQIKTPIPDVVTEGDAAHEKLNEILMVLSVLTNYRFFAYGVEKAWFIPLTLIENHSIPLKCVWGQKGYHYPEFGGNILALSNPGCPGIEGVDSQIYYQGMFAGSKSPICFPSQLNLMLERYWSLSGTVKKRFDSSCSLFSNGSDLLAKMPSLSFVAFISCIETLTEIEYGDNEIVEACSDCHSIKSSPFKCKKCGRPIWGAAWKFREFLKNYCSPDTEFKKYAKRLYSLRSAILHQGQLLLADFPTSSWNPPEEESAEYLDRLRCRSLARLCLVNWLMASPRTGIS